MYTFITILIGVICLLMVLVVLVQKPKGGVAANFGGSNQVMGAKRTSDIVEKTTWVLTLVLFFLTLTINFWIPRDDSEAQGKSILKDKVENTSVPTAQPAAKPADKPAEAAPASAPEPAK